MSKKPSYDYAMKVHAEFGKPSCRKLEELLRADGYDISYRTLQRWIENGKPGQVALGHATKVTGVKQEIAKALLNIADSQKLAADQMKVDGVEAGVKQEIARGECAGAIAQANVQAEVDIIDKRITDLLVKSGAELDVVEQKARKILNIVLMEAAARRANVMVLIPKETSSLVEAFTTASKQTLTGGLDQPPAKGDPRTIEGDVIDVEPESELQSDIRKFLHAEGMA